MSTLVIKGWTAATKPIDNDNNFVNITGREGGLIAWALALMGIDPTTTILVGLDRVEYSSASLAGTESRFIPLQAICSTYYGYHKPWKAAVWIASLFVLLGLSIGSSVAEGGSLGGAIWAAAITSVMGIIVALSYYFLNRTLTLGFVENSGVVSGIRFKRSVIENLDVNQEQAKSVCSIVQKLIEAKGKRALQAARQ